MDVKALDGSTITINMQMITRRVAKVEKWSSFKSSTATQVSGGGGRIDTNFAGDVHGKIKDIKVTTSQTTTSQHHTRLYFEGGGHATFNDFDFVTMEGNDITILCYEYGNESQGGVFLDKRTGARCKLQGIEKFLSQVAKVRKHRPVRDVCIPTIQIAILIYLFYKLTGWEWWPWAKYTVMGTFAFFAFPSFLQSTSVLFNMAGERSKVVLAPDYDSLVQQARSLEMAIAN